MGAATFCYIQLVPGQDRHDTLRRTVSATYRPAGVEGWRLFL
jgi:hypothetical protein